MHKLKYLSIFPAAAVLFDTGDVEAAAFQATLDFTPLGIAKDAADILCLGYEEVLRQGEETAKAYKEDKTSPWHFP